MHTQGEFFQAIHHIEEKLSVGFEQGVRFKSHPTFDFPVNSISDLNQNEKFLEIFTTGLGLFGANGLLPYHYSELILERLQAGDSVLKDFLDLFNHRLIYLYYSAWKKSKFYITHKDNPLLSSLTGQYYSVNLREDLLFYSGYFSDLRKPAVVLKNLIEDYFKIVVKIENFQGKWFNLPETERTYLSSKVDSQYNNILGKTALLGSQAWDDNRFFYVVLGPLKYLEFSEFLPGKLKFNLLIELIFHFVGAEWNFGIKLILKSKDIPHCQIKVNSTFALGRNAWLKTRDQKEDNTDTVFYVKNYNEI